MHQPFSKLVIGLAALQLIGSSVILQAEELVLVGALRWDAWYQNGPDQHVAELHDWAGRLPFFARKSSNGALLLDGDKENVLKAEVAYARSVGVDYFIFGFYPDMGLWGQENASALSLNRAMTSFLALPDRMGIKFAVTLQQLVPLKNLEDIAESLSTLIQNPSYITTGKNQVPVFIYGQGDLDWTPLYGGDDQARLVVSKIREKVRATTGKEILFILMNYNIENTWKAVQKYGLDMVSTYSTFAPGGSADEQSFSACIKHSERQWDRAQATGAPYLPNLTIGWDTRPRSDVALGSRASKPGPWCAQPQQQELIKYVDNAYRRVRSQADVPFKSVVVYAWNEFTEGGWMVPTASDGNSRLELFRLAFQRANIMEDLVLRWPVSSTACELRSTERDTKKLSSKCVDELFRSNSWPCPPGTRFGGDSIQAPTGYEAAVWPGVWTSRRCISTHRP